MTAQIAINAPPTAPTVRVGVGRRIVHALTMAVVCGLSLFLVLYVGFGEGRRTYEKFLEEKLVAQGRVAQTAMEIFLRAGLPLRQYVGFNTLAEPILTSDATTVGLAALDPNGRIVFAGGQPIALLNPTISYNADAPYETRRDDNHIQAILPLRNKFETVGLIAITMPKSLVSEALQARFLPLVVAALALAVAYGIYVFFAAPRLRGRKARWLQAAYAAVFLAVSFAVIGTLLSLYSDGAQAKAKALANSLGERVRDIAAFKLNLEDFEGLDRTIADYRTTNPEISAAAIIVDGRVIVHSNTEANGKPWQSDSRAYEYSLDLSEPGDVRSLKVAITLPGKVIYDRVGRSAKNFAALFIASAFLAGLFLQLAAALNQGGVTTVAHAGPTNDEERLISLVKPVFFVGVFVEHLSYGFLPQFIRDATLAAGMAADYVSLPFTLYYLCFALTLIPAGRFSERNGLRRLMYGGLVLVTLSLLTLAYPINFWLLAAARAVSGVGQAMLFMGVQSYILSMASPDKRTQGAGIIVFGFQGGMISGAAIGSLLVVYLGPQAVFMVAAMTAIVMALYAFALVPLAPSRADKPARFGDTFAHFGGELRQIAGNFEFMRTMILVGVPAKAVMTGIIFFALPLLLSSRNYAQEDVGQIIMLYALSVLAANAFMSRRVDRSGGTFSALVFGALISGVGLVLIGVSRDVGLMGAPYSGWLAIFCTVTGAIVVGLAHGLINAPIITHIAGTELAAKIGPATATAAYRFLERVGHVIGPIVVGQVFLIFGQTSTNLLWFAGGVLVFGLLFTATMPRRRAASAVRP
jgi:predicted MFS family arabinose efflux permease